MLSSTVRHGSRVVVISFSLENSTARGIPVADVLRGNLEGLVGRDDLAGLNPNADSVRLKIEVSNSSFARSSHELTCVGSCPATNVT